MILQLELDYEDQLRSNSIFDETGIIVRPHDAVTGILPFDLGEVPPENTRELHCELTLTDTEGVTASQTFVLPLAKLARRKPYT